MPARQPISDLESHLGYWMRFVSNHVSHAFRLKVEAHGVTVAEWVLLRSLHEVDRANPSQLAERIGMTRGAISKLVERLVAKGLASREAAESDRRFQTVALTGPGRRLVPVLARLADSNDAEFFGHLDAKGRARLMSVLQDIADRHGLRSLPVD